MKYIIVIICFFITSLTTRLFAQTIPVGIMYGIEDVYRRDQLLGNDSIKSSFMIRPLFIPADSSAHSLRKLLYRSSKNTINVYALPLVLMQQYSYAVIPYSANDGAMIPAAGYQGLFSAGIYASIGPLSIQFRPEVLYAQNRRTRNILNTTNAIDFVTSYNRFMQSIDLPERFGNGPYRKFNLGQSSIRLTKGPVSLGFSNENLWWGPGMQNSLLMSNTSPGFLHFTLNTVKPVQTIIGSFEAQIIRGSLKSSGIPLPAKLKLEAKPDVARSITGMAMTYQPKWAPGLYLGFDYSSVKYKDEVEIERSPTAQFVSNLNKGQDRDSYRSFFFRWVLPESHSEVYLQYGLKRFTFELPITRDSAVAGSDHIRAYIAGYSRLIPLGRASDEFIKLGIELTEMGNRDARMLYPWPSWYNNFSVLDGYTNQGQLIGAAVGPGGNMQSFDVAWVKGFKRVGFQIDRMVHNNDMFYSMRPYTTDIRRHWVDLMYTGRIDWDFGKFIFNSQLTYTRSLNYQWTFERPGNIYKNKDFWDWNKQDVNNLQARLGVMYRF